MTISVKQLRALLDQLEVDDEEIEITELPDPILWAEQVSQTALDPWQASVLRSQHPRDLLNCSRQSGKSQISSLRAAYRALYLRRDQIVIAPTLRQSGVIFRRCSAWLASSGAGLNRSTSTLLELSNGATIHCLPGDRPDFVRGLTADDLIIDEASRIKASLIAAVTPIISTRPNATITMLSTPAGKTGAFYDAWQSQSDWRRTKIRAEMCPRISPAFLAEEKLRLGDALYSQEYQCEFIADSFSVLDPDALAELFRSQAPESPFVPPTPNKEELPLWITEAMS